ncbi:MAG: phosphoribosylanthranilate isomerase [Candidatus Puniceispirillaceae bacterium]
MHKRQPHAFSNLGRTGAKICGISSVGDYTHCAQVGAAFIGMVFFEKSPRHLSWDKAEAIANHSLDGGPIRVALTVNASDDYLSDIIRYARPDMIQLHGDETPERTAIIKDKFNLPVMKALRVKSAVDIASASAYYAVADWLLFDADSGNPDMPGGTGHHFDWSLVSDLRPPVPWMLAGGLTANNLPHAKAQTPACYFDVSSAVERERGKKDHALITKFIEAVNYS